MILRNEKVVEKTAKESIAGRHPPADTTDVDLSGIELQYRSAVFRPRLSQLSNAGGHRNQHVEGIYDI